MTRTKKPQAAQVNGRSQNCAAADEKEGFDRRTQKEAEGATQLYTNQEGPSNASVKLSGSGDCLICHALTPLCAGNCTFE